MYHSNRPDLARIAGTGQLFSHFSATASRSDTMHMRPVAVEDGPHLHFPILDQPPQPCLQAAAFSEAAGRAGAAATSPSPSGGGVTMSLSVLNICNQSVITSLFTDADADGVPYRGTAATFRRVHAEGGARALFAGVVPRTGWICVGGAGFLGVYEQARAVLRGMRAADHS